MNKLLIFTTVSKGHYEDYVPLWMYCISKSYPEYDSISITLEVDTKVAQYAASVYRFLCRPPTEHPYVYINDVDMMVLRESISIVDFHTAEMRETGLCYSNTPRRREYLGTSRLTGLHFVNQEWYPRTSKQRELYENMLKNGEIGNSRFDDELVLMKIARESGLKIPKPRQLLNRHHGIHLGTIRSYVNRTNQTINAQLGMRITPEYAQQWIAFYDDPDFQTIVKVISEKNRTIKNELTILYAFCRRLLNAR